MSCECIGEYYILITDDTFKILTHQTLKDMMNDLYDQAYKDDSTLPFNHSMDFMENIFSMNMYMYTPCNYCELDSVKYDTCPICIEEFDIDSEVICMPCKHVYHYDCICNWFERSYTCPICKS